MRKLIAAAFIAAATFWSGAASAAGPLTTNALAFIPYMEKSSGLKIAVLDRIEDTQLFWARTAAILCEKTNDPWCSQNVQFMTANTEPSGFSQIIQYKIAGGATKQVCALLPPVETIDPSYVGEAFGTPFTNVAAYPNYDEMSAWLILYHAAHCLDNTATADPEARATAFATLGLSLMQGSPIFVPGVNRDAATRIAVMTKLDAAYWAAGTGERILLDYWKNIVAYKLRTGYGCNVSVVQNTSIDVEAIHRDQKLPQGGDCSSSGTGSGNGAGSGGGANTTLTDANLWIWMYGNGGLGAPPAAYSAFAPFGSVQAAADYILSTANVLGK
ncbi:hypothetical protein [Rhizobium leguminosarum]|jgi:hypothetical protein|uniref:hypothetical protein n=1 Tax=Rhizobium leguminosarum TaxID=384 RepID=UPI002E0F7907|nr:hypothetical protein U8Q02_37730 [Rhizobium leguminosarum]